VVEEARAVKMAEDTRKRSEDFRKQLAELDLQYDKERRRYRKQLGRQRQRNKKNLDRQHPNGGQEPDQQRQFKAELEKQMKALAKIVGDGHAEALRLFRTGVSKFRENLTKHIKAELENLEKDDSNA
jgi:Xaa-Pro aminopeptidase